MFCSHCGHELREGASFCSFCGFIQKDVNASAYYVAGSPELSVPSVAQTVDIKPKKKPSFVRIIIASLIGVGALIVLASRLFPPSDPVLELTQSPVTGTAYRMLEEKKKFATMDGEFGGIFSLYEPDEGHGNMTSEGVYITYKYLMNGRQFIGRFDYEPSKPIEEFAATDVSDFIDMFIETGYENAEVTNRKDFVIRTKSGKAGGARYHVLFSVNGHAYEQFEKLICIYRDPLCYSLYELRYQNEVHADNEKNAEDFFDSCFIKDFDLKERKP